MAVDRKDWKGLACVEYFLFSGHKIAANIEPYKYYSTLFLLEQD